jgi:hypothetical protein
LAAIVSGVGAMQPLSPLSTSSSLTRSWFSSAKA